MFQFFYYYTTINNYLMCGLTIVNKNRVILILITDLTLLQTIKSLLFRLLVIQRVVDYISKSCLFPYYLL